MELGDVAQRQGGLFTRAQARAAGLSDRQVTAVLSCAPCALGVGSAAAFWGWAPWPHQTQIIVDRRRRVRPPSGVRAFRLSVPSHDITERRHLPITTPARTLVDCLRFLPRPLASEVLDRSQQRGAPTLAAVAALVPRQGVGTKQARALLAAADRSLFAAEKLAARLLRDAGVGGWTANLVVRVDGRRYVIDLAFQEARLAIEIDGFAHHSDPSRFQGDRTRQNALIRAGWTVLRFTWHDLTERPHDFVHQVRHALAATGGQLGTA